MQPDIEKLARALCNDFEARVIAGQIDAPDYDDSELHVREYWRAIARAAMPGLRAYDGWSGPNEQG